MRRATEGVHDATAGDPAWQPQHPLRCCVLAGFDHAECRPFRARDGWTVSESPTICPFHAKWGRSTARYLRNCERSLSRSHTPYPWSALFSMARLSADGPKRRPIAVGSTMRMIFASAWCADYRPWMKVFSAKRDSLTWLFVGAWCRSSCECSFIMRSGIGSSLLTLRTPATVCPARPCFAVYLPSFRRYSCSSGSSMAVTYRRCSFGWIVGTCGASARGWGPSKGILWG